MDAGREYLKKVSESSRERMATMTVVVVSIFHMMINISVSLSYGYFVLLYVGALPAGTEVEGEILQEIAWISYHATSFAKVRLYH